MAANAVDRDACPGCKGRGRRTVRIPARGEGRGSFLEPFEREMPCGFCEGTGNRDHARLLRAYRLGCQHGIQAMMNAMPNYGDDGPWGADKLLAHVNQEIP